MKPNWFQKPRAPQKQQPRFPSSFAERWGNPLLFEGGFLGIPSAFLEHYNEMGLSAAEALFFLQLMSFKWTKEAPFPCYKTLSKRMGVTEEAVRNYAKSLEDKGLLIRVFRKGRSNAFDISPLTAVLLNLVLKARKEKAEKKLAA